MPVENISDTALWVAVYRALESERPDAIIQDPYARRLAGARGEEMARALPVRGMDAVMAVRTRLLDDLIMQAVLHDGVDAVVNLAAGLDSRPYRLALPAEVRWYEVDLPPLTAYKEDLMAGETPKCKLERIAADLADEEGRRTLFKRIGAESQRALVITEGLLVYLTGEQVASIAHDLAAVPTFRYWAADVIGQEMIVHVQRAFNKALKPGQAQMQWGVPADGKFFEGHGWRERKFMSFLEEGLALKRKMPMTGLWQLTAWITPAKRRERIRRMSGIVALERA